MLDINSKKFENLSGRNLYSRIFSEIGAQNKDVVMLGPHYKMEAILR
jgi:ABC-type branched-subunit amino acid transport system substrate-binding protein